MAIRSRILFPQVETAQWYFLGSPENLTTMKLTRWWCLLRLTA